MASNNINKKHITNDKMNEYYEEITNKCIKNVSCKKKMEKI